MTHTPAASRVQISKNTVFKTALNRKSLPNVCPASLIGSPDSNHSPDRSSVAVNSVQTRKLPLCEAHGKAGELCTGSSRKLAGLASSTGVVQSVANGGIGSVAIHGKLRLVVQHRNRSAGYYTHTRTRPPDGDEVCERCIKRTTTYRSLPGTYPMARHTITHTQANADYLAGRRRHVPGLSGCSSAAPFNEPRPSFLLSLSLSLPPSRALLKRNAREKGPPQHLTT